MKPSVIASLILSVFLLPGCSGKQEPKLVKFEGKYTEKKWAIKELNADLPSDWSAFRFLTLELNSTTTQRFELCIHDKTGTRKLQIHPFQGVWIRASLPLVHYQKMNTEGMDMAAIWKTARPGYWIGFTGSVGPITDIDSLSVAMNLPVGTPMLEIRNVRLTMTPEDTVFTDKPLVDEFGQWIPADWPGKAKSIDDLNTSWAEEGKSLKAETSGISKYGGFSGTKAKATGFFHVEKIDGKWWFIDPDGCLFFSNGSCCIEPGMNLARTDSRKYIFTVLPPEANTRAAGSFRRHDAISSFYTWNLSRRFGTDWYQKWKELTAMRMKSWGINTIGNWSDPSLGEEHNTAYVATLHGWGIETGKMGMPDIYAPGYAAMVDSAAASQCGPKKKDPYLLGYFIGNEMPWPGREPELSEVILEGEDTPIQAEFKKYLASGDSPERRKEFIHQTYARFLSIVCSAIKKHDPYHLNLGLRFGETPADDIIEISKNYFDVFSINHYGYEAPVDEIRRIYDLTGLPVIIGEFHFGTPGRGLAPGLAQTSNMEERAVAYSFYIENAAAHPALIGAHWFQWIDQPNTGRSDGENYNIGLVDVTDQPYPDMIKATRETFSRLLSIHSGKELPVTRQALRQ